MKKADVFIILDNAQLPGKGLANRNYIKGKDGKKVLLTVPIKKTKGVNSSYIETIPDYSKAWQKEHLNKIKDHYNKWREAVNKAKQQGAETIGEKINQPNTTQQPSGVRRYNPATGRVE
jgi:hypothetical protein